MKNPNGIESPFLVSNAANVVLERLKLSMNIQKDQLLDCYWGKTMDEVQPIFASSIFTISLACQVYQVLCYDYLDPKGVYAEILHDENAFRREVKKLRSNMQRFLDAEQVAINGYPVKQEILQVDIGLRGTAEVPYIQWVVFFQGPVDSKENILSSFVAEEVAEYDIEVLYLFPEGTEIHSVQTPMEFDIRSPLLLVWARKGDKVGGYEEVKFQFTSS
jgi:hypothetical protein